MPGQAQAQEQPRLPREPIDRILEPFERFIHVEASGGIVLLACAVLALGLANSPLGPGFLLFWETEIGVTVGALHVSHSLAHWINDGLMVLFFFVVGLEVKREIVLGELRDPRRAALPVAAAIGGMVAPAGIYLLLCGGTPAARGWGVPMATDIAFVVGCMAILGSRIPAGLRVMLLSLAIADDIGAILVIAVAYTSDVNVLALCCGFAGVGLSVALARIGVRSRGVYLVMGVVVWIAFLGSGVHPTIAGVFLGLATPARPYLPSGAFAPFLASAEDILHDARSAAVRSRAAHLRAFVGAARETVSPLEYLELVLHPWVAFVVMPIFALANAGVVLDTGAIRDPVAVAVAAGLVLGKPLGIVGASWLAVRAGAARLPEGVGWGMVAGGGALAGIGFTMALFVADLAIAGSSLDAAKIGILASSALAGLLGMGLLLAMSRRPVAQSDA